MRSITEGHVLGVAAAAERDRVATFQVVALPVGVLQRDISFNVQRTIVEYGDLCHIDRLDRLLVSCLHPEVGA